MGVFDMTKCCCCLEHRLGILILGSVSFMVLLIGVIENGIRMTTFKDENLVINGADWDKLPVFWFFFSFIIILYIIGMISSILLIIGVAGEGNEEEGKSQRNPFLWMMIPWMVFNVICILFLFSGGMVIVYNALWIHSNSASSAALSIIPFTGSIILIYLELVVFNFYKQAVAAKNQVNDVEETPVEAVEA